MQIMDCLITLCFACHFFFLSFWFACLLALFLSLNTCTPHHIINSFASCFFGVTNTNYNKQSNMFSLHYYRCVWNVFTDSKLGVVCVQLIQFQYALRVCVCILWMKMHYMLLNECMNEKCKQTKLKTSTKFNTCE